MHTQEDGAVSLAVRKGGEGGTSSFHLLCLGDCFTVLVGGAARGGAARHRGRLGGSRQRRPRLDPSTLHVRQQLVGNLRQDILGQPGHAQNLVPRAVDVVSERNKLSEKRHKWRVHRCFTVVLMSHTALHAAALHSFTSQSEMDEFQTART